MARAIVAAVLLSALAASELGCAWGYVTYFEPERKGAREVPHRDPYMRPPPDSGVELDDGTVSVACTNVETLVLPIRGRTRLDAPRLVTFTFSTEIRDASEFRMSLGEFSVDGTRTLLPPLTPRDRVPR